MRNRINIKNMPLLYALSSYKKNKFRYHMPGHKGNINFNLSKFDITELSFSGNLFGEECIIAEAERLYANCYIAKAVKFSAAGTTACIISFFHSIKHLGGSVIIQKNSHKSVYNALELCGLNPIIIECEKNDGLYTPVSANQVKAALNGNDGCIGAVITSPDYYGFKADLVAIKEALGDKLLIVDAAHGSHLPFIDAGIYSEADIYFCSAHKNLPALTPAAFAAFNNTALYQGFVKSLEIFHTSSPSYALLASMDYAREYMQKRGAEKLMLLKKLSEKYKRLLHLSGFDCRQNDDFTKLIICHKNFSGFDLANLLERQGLFVELADERHILALFTVADGKKQYKKLYKALKNITRIAPPQSAGFEEYGFTLQSAMPYMQAAGSDKELISLENAAGRVAAANCGLFPPSYPLICCGEVYTQKLCRFLINNKQRTFGVDNGCVYVVK